MTNSRRVGVVLDFVCVHSYIGFTRFTRAARRYRVGGGEVEVAFRPFRLEPDVSPVGEPLFEFWRRERGETFVHEVTSDTSLGVEDGLELNFARAVFTNTFDAHRILAQASAQGWGERMAGRLYRAYFTDGLNIADHGTLSRLATETGVVTDDNGAAELRVELDRVRQLGIQAPPVFRFEGGPVLTGEQSEKEFLVALES